jgi:hypothetical protein
MRSGKLIKISLNIWEMHCHSANCALLQVGWAPLTFFSYGKAEQGGDHPASYPHPSNAKRTDITYPESWRNLNQRGTSGKYLRIKRGFEVLSYRDISAALVRARGLGEGEGWVRVSMTSWWDSYNALGDLSVNATMAQRPRI